MPKFMIRREYDAIPEDELMALAVAATGIRVARFPSVEWERTLVERHDSGAWTLLCIYEAPDAQPVLDYSAAAGLPVDEVTAIAEMLPEHMAAVSA